MQARSPLPNIPRKLRRVALWTVAAATMLWTAGAAAAPAGVTASTGQVTAMPAAPQGHPVSAMSESQYQRGLARCRSIADLEPRAKCLHDVKTAYAAGRPDGADAKTLASNATERCRALPDADRSLCVARMSIGTTDGSVAAGGISRELRVVEAPR